MQQQQISALSSSLGEHLVASACPQPNSPLEIVREVCREYDGNSISSVGTTAALLAMAMHWENHLSEGHDASIIPWDLDQMKTQLDKMHKEIVRRMDTRCAPAAAQPTRRCKLCSKELVLGYCQDDFCPYSEWPQHVALKDILEKPAPLVLESYSLSPRIRVRAEVHDDTRLYEVAFDAAPWFAQCSEQEILDLRAIGWRGDYAADAVAQFFEERNPRMAALFDYCRSTQGTRHAVGFECSVHADGAMSWLKEHRPELWRVLSSSQFAS